MGTRIIETLLDDVRRVFIDSLPHTLVVPCTFAKSGLVIVCLMLTLEMTACVPANPPGLAPADVT